MSGCMCMGQAAGIVAAWSARTGKEASTVGHEELKSMLLNQNVFLKPEKV